MKPQLILGDIIKVRVKTALGTMEPTLKVTRLTIDKVYAEDDMLDVFGEVEVTTDNHTFISRSLPTTAKLKPMDAI